MTPGGVGQPDQDDGDDGEHGVAPLTGGDRPGERGRGEGRGAGHVIQTVDPAFDDAALAAGGTGRPLQGC